MNKCRKCKQPKELNVQGVPRKCLFCMDPIACRICGKIKDTLEMVRSNTGIKNLCLECENMKKCPKCNNVFPKSDFHKRGSYCKKCISEYAKLKVKTVLN